MSKSRSKNFNELIRRIKLIEKNLLPSIKPIGDYTKKEQDMIRGYRLLVHAELEAYFEGRAKEKVINAIKEWKVNRKQSNVLLALMSYNEITYYSFSNEKHTEDRHLEKRLEKAVTHFMTLIANNHGIKELNIMELLCPIGVEIKDLQQTWLNDLNSFGSSRGLIAHSSAKTQQPIDPATERSMVTSILHELKKVDSKINALS
jgi:hypothetical protein